MRAAHRFLLHVRCIRYQRRIRMATTLGSFCRIATPFAKDGSIDEEALRAFLQRFIKSKIGVYLGSAGGGETHALTREEIGRIYEIGLEECKGKIPVYANPPEQY